MNLIGRELLWVSRKRLPHIRGKEEPKQMATNKDYEVQGKHPTEAGTSSLPLGGLKNPGKPQVLMWEPVF